MEGSALDHATAIFVAALGGAAVGVERQWSGHASGARARFAGVRTFTLLGGVAGIAGVLWTTGSAAFAALLLGAALAVVVAGYVAASRRDVEATTEVAGLVVVAAGVLAGSGMLALASGVIAVACLLLVEKSRLHGLIGRFEEPGIRAGARFAVMAVVVLPLLPSGPFGPWGGVRPRELWAIVLFVSGLSFAGYVARQAIGARRGLVVAGLLGGIVSSTSVTLGFARASRSSSADQAALAAGAVGASTVMFARLLLVAAVLNPGLAAAALPYLAAPFAIGVGATALAVRAGADRARGRGSRGPANPLEIGAAMQMALLFQAVLFAVHGARALWGDVGVLASGALLGLTDTDALSLSMAKTAQTPETFHVGAQAIALGALSNTLLKLTLACSIGGSAFRRHAARGLAALAAAGVAALALCA